jgi:molybdopterin/thiamine biosynthesis adenylyltransferase/rhodanese-related sulfurtransferase
VSRHSDDMRGPTAEAQSGPLLTGEQMERYSRQIRLAEVGVRGQARLLSSKVAIVGAGGLGSPVAIYLAAAGVGTIGLIDSDHVDLSNLHRQPLHFEHTVGLAKVRSGSRHLQELNRDITVVEHPVRLTSENALAALGDYDLVVNGTDNFPTRYLINDACVLLGKPLVDASILQWEGHLNVFLPGKGCYRCLFPKPPAPGTVPSCAEAGIMGAVAGVMGTMQALEALKVLLNMDGVTHDRTLALDASTGAVRTLRRHRRPDCPVCGDAPSIRELIDYELFCGLPVAAAEPPPEIGWNLNVEAAAHRLGDPDVVWIDVREPWEFAQGRVPGSRLIRLDDLPGLMHEIPRDRTALFVCLNGERSGLAVEILRAAGYSRAYNVNGGMLDWENHGYPSERGDAARRLS